MNSLFPGRKRALEPTAPTADQSRMAEEAMYAAMCRGRSILVQKRSVLDRVTITHEVSQPPPPAKDALSDIGNTSVEDFMSNFRVNGLECMQVAYDMVHPVGKSALTGSLTTSLPEDVFHLIESQLSLVDDFLKAKGLRQTDEGDNLTIEAVQSILRNLWHNQTDFCCMFFRDVESCIAAGNDFLRMADYLDAMMEGVTKRYSHLTWEDGQPGEHATAQIRRDTAELLTIFSNDALNASQRAVNFILHTVKTSNIPENLFSRQWEEELVRNEVAVSIVKTYADYLSDIETYVDRDFIYHKVVGALVRSTVCFYTEQFVKKAAKMRQAMKRDFAKKRSSRVAFISCKQAIRRISHDIKVFEDYFRLLSEGSPTLGRLVTDELSILVVLVECMWLAVDRKPGDSLEEYVVVVHKKVSGANSAVTRHLLSDLWLLMGPRDEHHSIESEVRMMDAELQNVTSRVQEIAVKHVRAVNDAACLQLDEVLRNLYQDRILQENSSACRNLWREVRSLAGTIEEKDASQEDGFEKEAMEPRWQPFQRIRNRIWSTKYENELSSLFR